MREEERLRAEVRKWGHSLGVVLPKNVAKNLNLKPHEVVEIKVTKKPENLMDLFGTLKFQEPTDKIIKEVKKGWKD